MGYKIREDAPRALSLPTPVGGGDFSPTATERIYEPGQTIEVITTDIVERFEAGDPHLVQFIEEIVEVDTREVEPTPAPGDVVPEPVQVQNEAQPDAQEETPEPVAAEPEAEPAPSDDPAEADVVSDPVADETPDNPFAT